MTEREIFLAWLDFPDAEARATYLDRACGGNHALRRGSSHCSGRTTPRVTSWAVPQSSSQNGFRRYPSGLAAR